MNITCEKCGSRFNFPDEKVPENRTVTLPCPRCGNQLPVGPRKGSSTGGVLGFEEEGDGAPAIHFDEKSPEGYDADERPFDFMEEEGLTAIICINSVERREKVRIALDLMEYSITQVLETRSALKNMRYHRYDVVVVDEMFDTKNPGANGVLIYLNRQPMAIRRCISVFLMSETHRTRDEMVAFRQSVNMVVNNGDIDNIDSIIEKGVRENALFYRVYNEFKR